MKFPHRRRNSSCCWHMRLIFFLVVLLALASLGFSQTQEDDDEYVREVLEEDYRNDDDYFGDSHTTPEEEYERQRKKQAEREEMLKQQELLEEEKRKQRIAHEREAKFEAELRKASEEKQKALKKQKKRDTRIVKQVLKAAARGDHYGVLGIKHWGEYPVGGQTIQFPFVKDLSFKVPGFVLLQMTAQKIKRAYRSRAMAVHPDKNRDGRANEAFVAVENSASILSDPKQRKVYDEERRLQILERRQRITGILKVGAEAVLGTLRKGFGIFRSVLGPFAFPVMIIGSLLI